MYRFRIGETNAYHCSYGDGLEFDYPERALYCEDVLEELQKSGYRVLDYHGNIIDPNGNNIKEYVEEPNTLSNMEAQDVLSWADNALDEAEAASYFNREVHVQEVNLKEPNVAISTREALEEYLRGWQSRRKMGKDTELIDVMPINSFVAKEALYEIKEIMNDSKARYYYDLIVQRRVLSSYKAYESLIGFLQNQGVLGNEYVIDDIKQAYLSWGFCGIKTAIVDMKLKIGETCSIENPNSDNMYEFGYAILTKSGDLHWDDKVIHLDDYATKDGEYSTSPVVPVDLRVYEDAMRDTDKWAAEYKLIKVSSNLRMNRIEMVFEDTDGLIYIGRVDNIRTVITHANRVLIQESFLTVRTPVSWEPTNLYHCKTEYDFLIWNLAKCKVRDFQRAAIVPTPVKSSYELYLSEGVSPEAAINWGGIMQRENIELNDADATLDLSEAGTLYRRGPEQSTIDKYNPNGYAWETLDELIDILVQTKDDLVDQNQYLTGSKESGTLEERADRRERPVEVLEFAKAFRDGTTSVDNLKVGFRQDEQADVRMVAELLVLYLNFKGITDIATVEREFEAIESNAAFDEAEFFYTRDAALRGYYRDKAYLNRRRAIDCTVATMVTRVYRENSNAPIPELRHYAFDCVALNLRDKKIGAGDIRNTVTNGVVTAIQACSSFDYFWKEVLCLEAPSFALKLMFGIYMNQVPEVGAAMGTTAVKLQTNNVDLTVRIPTDAYNAIKHGGIFKENVYCTLFDWCTNELMGTKWGLYCLNAKITPWEVQPLGNIKLPTYNFMVNSIPEGTFTRLSPGYQANVKNAAAKITSLETSIRSRELIEVDSMLLLADFVDSQIDCVLDEDQFETLEQVYEELQKLFTQPEYLAQKEQQVKAAVLDQAAFEAGLTQLLQTGDSGYPITFKVPDTRSFREEYLKTLSRNTITQYLINKKSKCLVRYMPLRFLRGFVYKVKCKLEAKWK